MKKKALFFFTFLLFNRCLSLLGSDTLLIRIIDLGQPIKTIVKDQKGKIFIQQSNKVFELKDEKLIRTSIKIQPNDKIFLYDGKLTTVDFLKNNNISIPYVNTQYFEWNKFLASPGTSNYVVACRDNNDNYWVINQSKFLYCFRINHFFQRSLNKISIRGIYKKNNNVYVNSYSGFYKNNAEINIDSSIIGSSNIFENSGKLYFSTVKKIYSYDTNNGSLNTIYEDRNFNIATEISSLAMFENKFYVGANKGLFSLSNNANLKSEGINETVHNIKIIENKLYICADNAIYVNQKGRFVKLPMLDSKIRYNDLEVLNGCFFIASSNGFIFIDPKNNIKKHIFENSIIKYNESFSIEKDRFDNFWIGTANGIIRYDLFNDIYNVFYRDFEFNKRSSFKIEDEFFFGSTDGYIRFLPNTFSTDYSNKENDKLRYYSRFEETFYIVILILIVFISIILYNLLKIKRANKSVMIESNNESAQEAPVKSAYTINNIEKYIMDNLDDLTVEKLREDSGYTKNVFYKIFSQHYDISPKQLIDSIKEDKTRKKYSNRKSNPR
jgi:hypothetical protein